MTGRACILSTHFKEESTCSSCKRNIFHIPNFSVLDTYMEPFHRFQVLNGKVLNPLRLGI